MLQLNLLIIVNLLLSSMNINAQQLEINEVRIVYFKIKNDNCNALKLAQQFEKTPPRSAVLIGYHGAALAASPECISNPAKKLSQFKKGKKLIDEAIKKEPSNIEIRFLRFATQSKAPGFLGYKKHLEEDKNFLIKNIRNLHVIKHKEVINIITKFIIESDLTDQKEEKIVNDFLKVNQKY